MSALPKNKSFDFLKQNAIYFVLLILLGIIIAQDPTFLNVRNFSNILTQSSVRLIIALGVAGLLITQGTDLSAGRQVGLAAVISATLLQSMENMNRVFPDLGEIPIPVVILTVCAVGAVIGLVNGLVIAYLNVTPFIATMGTMIIVYGFNSLFFAIGGNPEAAKVSGVNVARNLVVIYMIAGMFYAFGGMLEAGRIGSATNNLGFMYELDAIAACVVGGVSFAGGVGTVIGVITGVIIFTVINYGLTYIGVNPYWQYSLSARFINLIDYSYSSNHFNKIASRILSLDFIGSSSKSSSSQIHLCKSVKRTVLGSKSGLRS